jgi:F-type H+-transporting ATPase subunit delta
MPNPRLAARYAKSLIGLAVERNQLDAVYSDMLFLESVCKTSRQFVNFLKSPVIKADKKEKIIDAITKNRVNDLTAAFNKLLIVKGREAHLPEIVSAFIQQYKDYKGINIVKLITAVPVSDEMKNSIAAKIKSGLNMDLIELNAEVKEELIGGFVLEIGDKLIDASIAYDLNNIKKEFESNDFVYKIR